MKRNLFSPPTGVFSEGDTRPDKKQRTMQENGSAASAEPAIAETAIEPMAVETAPHETTEEETSATSDSAGYNSDSLELGSSDDSSVSDSIEWPPKDSNDDESRPDEDQQSYLCSRCCQIDFDEIFSRTSVAKGGDEIMFFNGEQRVLQDPECALCRALEFIYPSLDMRDLSWKQRSSLVVTTIDDRGGPLSNEKLNVREDRICLTFAYYHPSPYHPVRGVYQWTRGEVAQRESDPAQSRDLVGCLAEKRTVDSHSKASPAASVKARVDFDFIKGRLDECRSSDSACRNRRHGDEKKVPGMRLIDCKTRAIVPAPERKYKYAALSYVWGISSSALESRPFSINGYGKLPDDLPDTIADAVLVALKLKIRYLWCDRYCIRQDPQTKEEKEEKHGQISQMHHIYEGASITIIAAAGDGPDYGLPGVGKKRHHPHVRIGSRTLLATLPDPLMLIDRSIWSTRGWTFQEGLLSRRALVFTDQQVYFQCRETGIFEALDMADEISPPLHPHICMGNSGFPAMWTRIDSYANRTLGNTQDILNGILGVLTHNEEVVYPAMNARARHITGLPVEQLPRGRSWLSALSLALGWECDIPGKRRDGFPSWSWVGWHCKGFRRNLDRMWFFPAPQSVKTLRISIGGPHNEHGERDQLNTLKESRHDFSKAKVLSITAPSLEARAVPFDTVSEDDRHWISHMRLSKFDNKEKRFVMRYPGFKHIPFINLSDVSLPSKEVHCFGIILDEDHPDIQDDRVGENGLGTDIEAESCATTLVVVEKDGGFERIGVSYVDRKELRQIGSTVREFRLI